MGWRKILSVCLVVLMVAAIGIDESFGEEEVPGSRSFHLSFTFQPYDWSEKAFSDTYSFIAENSDMIFHYFDEGVPWPEAYAESQYHDDIESTLEQRIKHLKEGQKVAVGVNFLAKDRRSLAAYWASTDNLDRPGEWALRSFKDPEVADAYINYCRRIIKQFKPDYFIYGMEVDSVAFDITDKEFHSIENMIAEVHGRLREEFPELPLVLTFMLGPEENMRERQALIQKLLPYTDIYAVSIYPYLFDGVGGNSEKIPRNLFSKVRSYIGDKPFAIAETGFNAKTWRVLSKLIWIPGNEESQANYVDFLLSESNKLNASFVNWWVPRDLDALWEKMKSAGADPMMSQWNSNGLVDAHGNHRRGLKVWKSWLVKPIEKRYNKAN